MNDPNTNILREKQLEETGKILSSFTHELNNHLATINESKGLLQDYIEMGRIDDEDLCRKLEKILTRLDTRADMINEMTKHLNSFAHRFDTPLSTFDLCDLIEEQLFFHKRTVRLKKVTLEKNLLNRDVSITSSPALLQYLFQRYFYHALNLLDENDSLKITSQKQGKSYLIGLLLQKKEDFSPSHGGPVLSADIQLCLDMTDTSVTCKQMTESSFEISIAIPLG